MFSKLLAYFKSAFFKHSFKLRSNCQNHKLPSEQKKKAYTLIEMLFTIFIMGLILTIVSVLLVTIVRASQKADARMQMRQQVEFVLALVRQDLRNADPVNSFATCDPSSPIELVGNADGVEFTLSTGNEKVRYFVENSEESTQNGQGNGAPQGNQVQENYIVREYSKDGQANKSELTGEGLRFVSFEFECSQLRQGKKLIIVTIQAESSKRLANGKPLVTPIIKQTGVVIRNTNM